ncbi:MAG TPA: LytTR family DNA-binding domain-containing protein, partial [Pseudoxanthomonas sp.]
AQGGLVVFTTAYEDYAIRAFEAGAADYLLKPVQDARLAQAVERMQARLAETRAPDMRTLIDDLEARLRPQGDRLIRWITASVGDSVRMIAIDDVLFFQAQDKYVRVVTADDEAIIRMPLKDLLGGLDPDVFWQVHRGVLVRVQAIDRARKDELGRHLLSVKGRDDVLPVSGAFQQRFRGM